MVGGRMFNYIDQRLREIKGARHKLFGGANILACGDLAQLAPVQDSWIFQCIGTQPSGFLDPITDEENEESNKITKQKAKDPRYYLDYNIWNENCVAFELGTIMRTNNSEFAKLQHRLR